ncbi:PREDICTED: uncharacterized protein LOC104748915 [Camelina sativa]|uniref:Uncharacterized protein LOC104748915 n=1 Tax=Camelina sativa TaxID=90675 RepID=A0ABM0WBS8_CAMSA|nr:PREDICTED: uncharacterized protein LOC104748915 [Camelina sativa]
MGKIFDLKIFFHGFLLRGGYDYVFSPLFRFDWSDWALFQGFRSLVFWDLRATSAGFSVSFLGGSVDWFRVRVSGYQGCFYCGIAFSSPLGFVAVTDGLFRSSEAHYKLVSSPVDILHPLSLSLNSFSKYQWRLKRVLPGLISETQSAFVPGRLISDNILIAQEMFHGLRTNPSCKGKFMAIKTDMSKAYDRVEWAFVEEILRKMGFAETWISWIMFCVTSVEYRVLLNGQPNGLIVPERGLRQGDPLSPYLFILCTEVLVANIRKAEMDKLITGIKVANKCPPITHLLFADDSLFFCKVDKDQCKVILDILKQYESVSGQQINFAKSSLQFGHKVDEVTKAEMQGVLGITNLGGMGSYLGLPESLGGAKTKVFAFVRDRMQSRTNGWTAKLLSKGGREVMIKSVATAVPTFVMSCFRLPKTITSKLTSAVANFWWSSNGQTGGMHWLAWDKLCVSKQLGGLGFRNIDDFNSALLAKQLWRLIEVPDSLFARVFKRLIKRVGTGESISVWNDPWIPAQFPRPALCTGPHMDPNLTVTQLIDRRTNTWRLDLLNELFDPTDVELIRAIPLRSIQNADQFGWHFTKTGKYTVKSGYHLARQEVPRTFQASGCGPEITSLLASVWRVPCSPKIQHFMWQVLSGCIPVAANLARRGIACDPGCVRCGAEEETINHAIFVCPPARQVSTFPWLMWYIWKARNARVYENIDERPEEIVLVAEGEAMTWQQAQVEGDIMVLTSAVNAPEPGQRRPAVNLPTSFTGYRCFVDGSWKPSDPLAGAGWVCSSVQDPTLIKGATNFRRSLSPLHAEVEAFIWAMRCMIGHDFRDVAFYTDCSDLVKMVSSPSDWPAFSAYLDDIKVDRTEFSTFSLSFISRNANVSADSLARQARTSPHHVLYVNNFPPNWLV